MLFDIVVTFARKNPPNLFFLLDKSFQIGLCKNLAHMMMINIIDHV